MSDNFDAPLFRAQWSTTVPEMRRDVLPANLMAMRLHTPQGMTKEAVETVIKTLPKQASRLDLVCKFIVAKASATDKTSIWCSIEDTAISVGKMLYNTKDHRGLFQDRVDVTLSLVNKTGQPVQDFRRASDGPETVNGSGATSSTVSFSFSMSGTGGFFGPKTGTGGGGVSGSFSESHTFSRSLNDFKVVNGSDDHVIRHSYQMSMSKGADYSGPADLLPKFKNTGFLDGIDAVFTGFTLYEPPDLAVNDMRLISQCVWQAKDERTYTDDLYVLIEVAHHLVEVYFDPGSPLVGQGQMHAPQTTVHHRYAEKIAMGTIFAMANEQNAELG
jgi:hypothetical protein